jgi:hypothetical protein
MVETAHGLSLGGRIMARLSALNSEQSEERLVGAFRRHRRTFRRKRKGRPEVRLSSWAHRAWPSAWRRFLALQKRKAPLLAGPLRHRSKFAITQLRRPALAGLNCRCDRRHSAYSPERQKLQAKVLDHDGRTPGPFRKSPHQEPGHHTLFARHSSGQTVVATYEKRRSRRYHP